MNISLIVIILTSLLVGLTTYERLVVDEAGGFSTPLAPNPITVLGN